MSNLQAARERWQNWQPLFSREIRREDAETLADAYCELFNVFEQGVEIVEELANSAISFSDPRVRYIEIQTCQRTIDDVKAWLKLATDILKA